MGNSERSRSAAESCPLTHSPVGSRLILLDALAEAEGLANEFEDVGVMGQTIQQGCGQAGILLADNWWDGDILG